MLRSALSTSTSDALTVPRSTSTATRQSPSATLSGRAGSSPSHNVTSAPGFASSRLTRLRTNALVSLPVNRRAYEICGGLDSMTARPLSYGVARRTADAIRGSSARLMNDAPPSFPRKSTISNPRSRISSMVAATRLSSRRV
jgi:hypothetical protein